MDTSKRDLILKAIAQEEELLTKFEHERKQALSKINTLKNKLASLDAVIQSQETVSPPVSAFTTPQTSIEKVKLFRSLFRGREDIYPKLWRCYERE